MEFKNHELVTASDHAGVIVEDLPIHVSDGQIVDGLHATRIALDNPSQLNSYTTEMVKGVILAMRRASNDRASVAVVFTATIPMMLSSVLGLRKAASASGAVVPE